MSSNFGVRIDKRIEKIAEELKKEGQKLDKTIKNEWDHMVGVVAQQRGSVPSTDDEIVWLAAVVGTSWTYGDKLPPDAIQFRANAYIKTFANRSNNNIQSAVGNRVVMKNGLKLWREILKEVSANQIITNPVVAQHEILRLRKQKLGGGHWSATVPFKVLWIAGKLPSSAKLNELEMPLGYKVREGISKLTGVEINEQRVSDITFAQKYHMFLAKRAGTDVSVINSGLWKLGSGPES